MLSKKDQKFIKSLKVKKYRSREKCFLVEGTKNVLELLDSEFEIEIIVGTDTFLMNSSIRKGIRVEVIKPDLLTQLSTFKTNEDVIAVARQKEWDLNKIDESDHLFVLDGVGDPGNMGTIIRTLDWFGFNQLICSYSCADFYNPKTISSSMGSFSRVKFYWVDLEEFYNQCKLPIFGANMNGESLSIKQFDHPSIFVMGSESHGLSETSKTRIKNYISIPRIGKAESLNVGIATGILANHLRMN